MASSSSLSISTLSMAATEMLAVLDAPEAFLKRLKNPFICRGIQRKVLILLLNLDYFKKNIVIAFG